MLKSRTSRFTALLAGAVLLGSVAAMAIASTGAYFTDSKGGNIHGTNGYISITVDGHNGGANFMAYDFTNLMPGETKTESITAYNNGPTAVDIWMVFDNANYMWSAVNVLGMYGKFTVGGNLYDNLSNRYPNTHPGVSAPGSGTMSGSCSSVPRVDTNFLPHKIFLGTLAATDHATGGPDEVTFPMSFQYIWCMSDHQGESVFNSATASEFNGTEGSWDGHGLAPAPLYFSINAFQPGVDPANAGNGAGAIPNLVLPIPADTRPAPKGTHQ